MRIGISELAVAGFFFISSGLAANGDQPGDPGKIISENIPHNPNFVGRNICLGIEPSISKTEWKSPLVRTERRLNSEEAHYEIILDSGNKIVISEDSVLLEDCKGLPLNEARWRPDGRAEFCISSWDKGKYVKVEFRASWDKPDNKNYVLETLYRVAPCKLGDHPNTPEYDDKLKVSGGVPVLGD